MTQGSATKTRRHLEIGESRDFPNGRGYTVSVVRRGVETYAVLVLDLSGLSVPCYTSVFEAERIPADMSVRRAAFEYLVRLVAEFGGDLETPAAIAARTCPIAA